MHFQYSVAFGDATQKRYVPSRNWMEFKFQIEQLSVNLTFSNVEPWAPPSSVP